MVDLLQALRAYHEAVDVLLTLPEDGMRDLAITKLADAHIAAGQVLEQAAAVAGAEQDNAKRCTSSHPEGEGEK